MNIKQAVFARVGGAEGCVGAIRATTQQEHAADAVAVAVAAFEAPLVYGIASVLGLTN